MRRTKFHHLGYWIGLLFLFLIVQSNLPQPQAQITNTSLKTNPTAANPRLATVDSQPKNDNLFLVTRVIDGDTIILADGRTIRYLGMDTPESVDPKKPVHCLAQAAAAKNKELVLGQYVSLIYDQEKIDKYGRTLAYVFVGDNFINLELVDLGLARAYPYAPNFLHRQDFADAQARAQQKKMGLWSGICEGYKPTTNLTTNNKQPPNPNCIIKGNISSSGEKIYHLPGQKYYNNTRIDTDAGEFWFCSKNEATFAGWRQSSI